MQVTRRGLLKFAGASAAGILFSPLPWKLLDDIAIWTQTGPWIPKVPRGPLTTAFSTCALCPGGCAVEARCAGGIPYAMRAAVRHTAGRGALCPVGMTGHHLAYHPLRLSGASVIRRTSDQVETDSLSTQEAFDRILGALNTRPLATGVAVIDQRPGRTLSGQFRAFLAQQSPGYYIVPDDDRLRMHEAFSNACGKDGLSLGFDIERTATLLTIGTPVFDGWTRPARTAALLDRRHDARNPLKLIHADPRRTRTSVLADQWLPIAPGSETALVLGLTNIVMRDHPSLAARYVADLHTSDRRGMLDVLSLFTPGIVAKRTGIPVDTLEKVGSALAHRKPSMVIAGGDAAGPIDRDTHQAVAALNILLGSYGTPGGLLHRDELPMPATKMAAISTIGDVPDGSISLLIIDGEEMTCSTCWESIESKLSPDGHLVVSTSPFLTQLSAHADIVLPSPAPYETAAEVVGDPTDTVVSLSISTPLLPRKQGSVEPIELLNHLSGESVAMQELLKQRIALVHARGRGMIAGYQDGSGHRLSEFASADEIWSAFIEGAVWTSPPLHETPAHSYTLLGHSPNIVDRWAARAEGEPNGNGADGQVILLPTASSDAASCGRISPLMTKIYQESEVRPTRAHLVLHPDTGRRCGVDDGDQAVVQTESGSRHVTIRFSASLMPGVAQLSIGPDPNVSGKKSEFAGSDVFRNTLSRSPMAGVTAIVRRA
ncbi:MAG: hypothetical protein A3G43_11610 [Ignavibacteria bacterium RIFCSPLOWO2_12_FULL_56_21]|nr:MAG: hypothetical protein A3C56_02050 [Ignavibacteria bacterium RIFCSPHIGHO2_02_FULL_56_12]OGU76086.1 MAG: hypothetical protein A3G43_11610 [Ignavibacteria bacterium RIFCSPLOWO2_12_FULL_56_21]